MKIDLTPAGVQFSTLIEVVRDAALGHLTPCREYCVGDLLDHIAGITVAFGGAAVKAGGSQRTWDPQEMQQTSIRTGANSARTIGSSYSNMVGPERAQKRPCRNRSVMRVAEVDDAEAIPVGI